MELRKKYGVEPELVRSSGGVFEVTVGNELIFSKKKERRFPAPGEVEKALEPKISGG